MDRKKILILITAFNVEKFIEKVILRLPKNLTSDKFETEILIIDDASLDQTKEKILQIKEKYQNYKITCLSNKKNLGYGGNQKIGYHYAIKNNFDFVVLLHGDGQYAPEKILDMLQPLQDNKADAVQGSRMIKKSDALKGNMPFYKFIGNISLTFIQNFLTGLKLSEYHSGYRAYRVMALKEIPFQINSNHFHFDTQILIQLSIVKKKIVEIAIPTFYGKEISSLNSIQYGFAILKTTVIYYLQKFSIFYDKKYNFLIKDNASNYESKLDFLSTHSLAFEKIKKKSKILSIGCGNSHLEKKLIKEKNCIIDGIDFFKNDNIDFLNKFTKIDLDRERIPSNLTEYDYILLLDVIEHLKTPEEFLNSLYSEMAKLPEQKLIISTPNVANIFIRIMLLLGNFNYGRRGILDRTHTRLFTLKTFKNLIIEQNFKIEEEHSIPPPFPLAIKNKMISSLLLNVFKKLNFFFKTLFAFQFLLVVKSKPSLDFLIQSAEIKK